MGYCLLDNNAFRERTLVLYFSSLCSSADIPEVFAPLLDNLSGMYDDCRDTTEDDNDEKEDDWHMVTKDWVGGLLGAYST